MAPKGIIRICLAVKKNFLATNNFSHLTSELQTITEFIHCKQMRKVKNVLRCVYTSQAISTVRSDCSTYYRGSLRRGPRSGSHGSVYKGILRERVSRLHSENTILLVHPDSIKGVLQCWKNELSIKLEIGAT